MFRTIATTAVLAATIAGGLAAAPAEARHEYRDARYSRHHGGGRDDRGYRCHDKGNGGLAIGALAGGLLGNRVAGHGDRTVGTVIGAAGGGLLGRSIDRHDGRC